MTIAIDLDGTLVAAEDWRGIRHIGDPLPGARDAAVAMVAAGHRVLVYSCRTLHADDGFGELAQGVSVEERAGIIRAWLCQHCIAADVWTGRGKPVADWYLDDRGLRVAPQEDPQAWSRALKLLGIPTLSLQTVTAVTVPCTRHRFGRGAEGGWACVHCGVPMP